TLKEMLEAKKKAEAKVAETKVEE
ncbi:MAG: hypothetical protein UV30_C0030G0012, partial [Candidatus Collierbacteria bacterium GW2011_GWF1_42_50]